ncbi:MAG: PDZ domain-containing protein [Candidatus Aminicenantes bacterium]|nr:PDZ domain-containing protein [Candidatus Aminicenantes bacterium]NIM84296.1 PDZ domain-containing protein [Candidatus Aminicenantes bacterium]NIN23782.1 PDZ domain-containing protein [Candidatus Aminicenantes bacterium]NIN47498.1 PDZ domain-containing protein [Candidatus Aminicenantes bacterium]NIN90418.1 PDZ domain-containing protein [Candidatus Aminicenantes bacterium]
MKRLIMMIFSMLVLFFTANMNMSLPLHAASDISKFEKEVKGILKSVSPSIVKVVAENHRKYVATGIAVERNHVVSNIMVIRQRYRDIYIETVDGNKLPARVVGKDNNSSLILLKTNKRSLTPIRWARTYDVGDWVAVVGVFYKKFPAIYQGMVSSASDEELILNAPVAPGSSGSAVVNKKGELVGMVRGRFGFAFSPDYTYKDHSSEILIQGFRNKNQNLCYAVPAKKVNRITDDLKKYGKVRRGWLGVLLTQGKDGVKITYVTRKSPADTAGLRKDDEVLKVDGKSVRKPSEVSKIIKGLKPHQEVKMELLREKEPKSVVVVIGEAKPRRSVWAALGGKEGDVEIRELPEFRESLPKLENYIFRLGASRTLGVDLMALTPELANEFNVKEGTGLMISKVYKNTAAEKAGFRPSDIIVKAGNKKIKTNSDLRKVLNELEDDETVDIQVYRKGKLMKISVVPDKDKKASFWFDRFRDTMKDIKIRVDDQKQLELDAEEQLRKQKEKLKEIREKYLEEAKLAKQKALENYKKYLKDAELAKQKELEKYKQVIEKMRQEQEKMKKEMEKLKQLLEKQEKKKKEKEKSPPTGGA